MGHAKHSDRRNPLMPFDVTLIDEWLDGRYVTEYGELGGGKSTSVYRFELSDGRSYVLRRFGEGGDPAREARLHQLARAVVRVPDVIGAGEDWLVLEHVAGVPLADCIADTSVHAAASAIARLSGITFRCAGWINAQGNVVDFPFAQNGESADEVQTSFHEQMLAHPEVIRWLGKSLIADARSVLKREAERMPSLEANPVLVHGDAGPTNILIPENGEPVLLDWEFSHSGTHFIDFANLRRNIPETIRPAIREGAGEAGLDLPDDWESRCELVDLSSHLEFLTSARSDAFKATRVDKVKALIRWFDR